MKIKSLTLLTGGILFAGSMIRKKLEDKAVGHENDLENSLRKVQEREQEEAKEENEKKWNTEYSAEFDKEMEE